MEETMREISLYKVETDYIIGSSKNIDLISKKINDDNKIIESIEKDYNSDNEKYRKEYICAMLNYKKNLRLYAWLVLKKYYEEAIVEEKVFPNYQIEEMKKHGCLKMI